MADVVLFHHVQGLTAGVRRLADELRAGGHTVHTPDFFEGATFDSIDDGFAAMRARGEGALDAWADALVAELPAEVVYAGISLGVMPAQRLAQTRPGAAGALLLEACAPASAFADAWPAGVPVQVHGMERDPFFGLEGDVDAARELVAAGRRRRAVRLPRRRAPVHRLLAPGARRGGHGSSWSSVRWPSSPASDARVRPPRAGPT